MVVFVVIMRHFVVIIFVFVVIYFPDPLFIRKQVRNSKSATI